MHDTSSTSPPPVGGYLHHSYADSYQQHGRPLLLEHAGASILERSIPNTPYADAMGPYPLLCCQAWSQLKSDLIESSDRLVAFSAITDPLGDFQPEQMEREFSRFSPFKKHYVVDLHVPPEHRTHKHHQRNIKRARKRLQTESIERPIEILDEWVSLYDVLIARHGISGLPRFSREIFRRQLLVPGLMVFRATLDGETVGISLWYYSGAVSYYHLAAYNDTGYRNGASFALFASAFEKLASKQVRWVALGAGAGTTADSTDGLNRFKAGWATDTRQTYLCGEIFDSKRYQQLLAETHTQASPFFPAYRTGEFS